MRRVHAVETSDIKGEEPPFAAGEVRARGPMTLAGQTDMRPVIRPLHVNDKEFSHELARTFRAIAN